MTELPPAGWYDDPTSPTLERWWDGERWSEQTRPKAIEEYQHRAGELRPIGEFLGHAFGLIRRNWDDFLFVAVVGAVLMALAAVAFLAPIADAITIDRTEIIGFGTAQAWQLAIFGGAALVIGAASSMAQYRIAWSAATDQPANWAAAIQFGVANAPRLIFWGLVAVLPVVALLALVTGLAFASGPLAVIVAFVGLAVLLWVGVAVALLPVALIVQRRGTNPIPAMIATVKGRWWRIFGRLILISIIAGLVVNVLTGILGQLVGSSFFGFEVVASSGGELEFRKVDVGGLDFFLSSLILFLGSFVGNVASFTGVTSIAFDVMPRESETGETAGNF